MASGYPRPARRYPAALTAIAAPLARAPLSAFGGPVRRSIVGAVCFWLLAIICLLELNGLGAQAFGSVQMFSYAILALCLVTLSVYHFTIWRDLGTSGRQYFLFLIAFLVIATPIGIQADSLALLNRWIDLQTVLSAALIIAVAAVAIRSSVLAYSLRTTLWVLFIVALLIPASVFLGMYWSGIYRYREMELWEVGRHTGFFANPNSCGVAGCFTVAIGYGLLTMTKRKLLVGAGLAVAAAGVVVTFSRAAIIMLLALTLAQVFISPVFRRKSIIIVGALLSAGILWFVLTAASSEHELSTSQFRRLTLLTRIFHGDFSSEATGARGEIALYALGHWLKSPIIGHGLGAQRQIGDHPGPHNTFIRILGEGGILPGALFLLFFAIYFRTALRCKVVPVRTIALGYLLLFFLSCMSGHNELVHRYQNVMIGICFGLLSGAAQMEQAAAIRQRRLADPRNGHPARFQST